MAKSSRRARWIRPARWVGRGLTAAAMLLVLAVGAGSAQSLDERGWDVRRELMDREALAALVAQLESVAEDPAYSPTLRTRAREELAIVRGRLAEGDLDVGDQIRLRVEGEADLSSTFVVREDGHIRLPLIGDVDLRGILRGELEEHLTKELSRFIREPVVSAQSLSHIAILGQVAEPGFYVVPSETLLADAIMMAGGPAPGARLDRMRIERAGQRIWEGEALQNALSEGRTLDRMSLRAGDQVIIPLDSPRTFGSLLQIMSTTIPLIMVLVALAGG